MNGNITELNSMCHVHGRYHTEVVSISILVILTVLSIIFPQIFHIFSYKISAYLSIFSVCYPAVAACILQLLLFVLAQTF